MTRRVLSQPTWKSICHAWGWRCAYCGIQTAELHAEHVDAVSNGGSPEIDNVVPACRGCNGSKSDSTLLRWLLGATVEKLPRMDHQSEQEATPSLTFESATDLIHLRQAAEIAGLHPDTLRQQILRGRLKAQKVGRDWTVTRKALEAYLATISRQKGPERGR